VHDGTSKAVRKVEREVPGRPTQASLLALPLPSPPPLPNRESPVGGATLSSFTVTFPFPRCDDASRFVDDGRLALPWTAANCYV